MENDQDLKRQLIVYQRNEVTEHHIYKRLAGVAGDANNKDVLLKIAEDELRHYHDWQFHTGEDVKPDMLKVRLYCWIGRLLGLTFAIKLMEHGEEMAQDNYAQIREDVPEAESIIQDEEDHEHQLIGLLDEERLRYVGSVVLGLNDALVELTGALAGLTLALQNTRLIAVTGMITGIAAALSMIAGGLATDLVGLALLALVFAIVRIAGRRTAGAEGG